ncbi:FAD-dependent oxidoreductase [Acinetobacter gerneri]|uniref:FAD-dependent oxidoreductase n=1 Tax=Acinetobacter gerneri TaxID=202952 RepID=A0AAW8JLH3_9GAMM|nr:FAD-dependent oxidoreductase [Acinetobacter gerneri]MDQ9010454.1 FAD-dependent oxidoreductase [Acinetobacter gerneri]MDQ9014653.1 FAD-dependent oxidoreductase [Acinetobacter gerneri]MDQ9025872.1 FAD-dependent oxidoreductase [Acinetobacter gerneri]MDQ9053105.1 FAD-dependent oxidoreductase [Acinetobacter gerneri]MDQ9060723.1 FAD-dependent oxidoreductase [Acinetobacter gerneri]
MNASTQHDFSSVEQPIYQTLSCDVLVIGSGAGGLSTAVTAAVQGLDVVVTEKASVFGGTTAVSGGWLWIPNTPHAKKAGQSEPIDQVKTYLKNVLLEKYDEDRIHQYLTKAPEMVDFFENSTAVKFNPGAMVPDFFDIEGSRVGWRSVVAAPFDGRELGQNLHLLKPAIPETTVWGMGIASGPDMKHFINTFRAVSSFAYATKRVLRHFMDLIFHKRSTQIVNGNALVARLLKSALDQQVKLLPNHAATDLVYEQGEVKGAVFQTPNGQVKIMAKHGVVLATGGFPHDETRKKQLFKHVAEGTPHYSAAPETNTGDGIKLAEKIGAEVDQTLPWSGAWAPVSLMPRLDGMLGRFPHLVERGKPGLIAVLKNGQRFTNEGESYPLFIKDLLKNTRKGELAHCWLICDHKFIRRYGLGAVKPFPISMKPWLENGYLKRSEHLKDLAKQCGIDAEAFEQSVSSYNIHAKQGLDPEFNRGTTPYQKAQGDADHRPNPCIAAIEHGPFYAIKVVPGSLGTFAGLITDNDARVLDQATHLPIKGLYAVGNDMNSIMGGQYPSGGITLGPAMTFGYLAAQDLVQKSKSASTTASVI